jgi:hypothetical protein
MRSRDGTIKLAETPLSRRYTPKLLSTSLSFNHSYATMSSSDDAIKRARALPFSVGIFKGAVEQRHFCIDVHNSGFSLVCLHHLMALLCSVTSTCVSAHVFVICIHACMHHT